MSAAFLERNKKRLITPLKRPGRTRVTLLVATFDPASSAASATLEAAPATPAAPAPKRRRSGTKTVLLLPSHSQQPSSQPSQASQSSPTQTSIQTQSRMRVPPNELPPHELRHVLVELTTVAKKLIQRDGRGGSSTGALVLYDREIAAQNEQKYIGPYISMTRVLSGLLVEAPKTPLSTGWIPHQHAMVRALFQRADVLFDPESRPSITRLDGLLDRASTLATSLFARLVQGWKNDLVPVTGNSRVQFTTQPGLVADNFWDWNPTTLTYRAIAIHDGHHVPSYITDFVGDFYARNKDGKELVSKGNPLENHPFVRRKLDEALHTRESLVKRSGARMGTAGKRTRHPCIGPLSVEDYQQHVADIALVYRYRADESPDADAAIGRLWAAFPSVNMQAVSKQHEFEMQFRELCGLVLEALFAYTRDGTGNIFGDNHLELHGMFCLTAMQNNKGDKFESINCKEVWFLRFLHRLMVFDQPDLKTKNYVPHEEFQARDEEERRHATNRSVDDVYKQMSGRIGGWVQSEFVKWLTTYYLVRARAYEHSGILEKRSRDQWLKFLNISRNDPDSFDDLIRARTVGRSTTDTSSLTSWEIPGSRTEETNLTSDAVLLAIIVVGRERAVDQFPDACIASGYNIPNGDGLGDGRQGAHSSSNRAVQLQDTEERVDGAEMNACTRPRGMTEAEILARLDDAECVMGNWLSLRQRCDKRTLLQRLEIALRSLDSTLKNVDEATGHTRDVRAAYHMARERQHAERLRILHAREGEVLSAREQILRDMDQGTEEREALETALNDVFEQNRFKSTMFAFKTSLAALVGAPPNWAWDPDDSDAATTNTVVAQTEHAKYVRSLRDVFADYAEYIGRCDDCNHMIDFVSPASDYVELLAASKEVVGGAGEQPDWVGFSKPIGFVRSAHTVLDCIKKKVVAIRAHPAELLRTMCDVIHATFLLAMEWSSVFSEHGMRLQTEQKTRMGIGVGYMLKVLSVAAANDAIDFAPASDASRVRLFRASSNAMDNDKVGRIDICSVDEMISFASTCTQNWKCVCVIASLTKSLLVYNREVKFNASELNRSVAEIDGLVSVTFSQRDFLLVHEGARDVHRHDLNAYYAKLCNDVHDYPPRHDWSYHDLHWTRPGAFKVLLLWLPDAAHDTIGFFPLAGVRDRSDKKNGFLNVRDTLPDTATTHGAQYWRGVCVHQLAATHGRLPTPPSTAEWQEQDRTTTVAQIMLPVCGRP